MAWCLRSPSLCRTVHYLRNMNARVLTVSLKDVSSVCLAPTQPSCQRVPHLILQSASCRARTDNFEVQRGWSSSSNEDSSVSYGALVDLIRDEESLIIDVREPSERGMTGQIGESINIPLGDLYSAFSLPEEAFTERYKMEKPGKDSSNVILHCMSGVRSSLGLAILKSIGYDKVRHFSGGWKDWAEKKKL